MEINKGSSNQREGIMKVQTIALRGVNRIIISKAIKVYPKYLTAFTMYSKILLNAWFLP